MTKKQDIKKSLKSGSQSSAKSGAKSSAALDPASLQILISKLEAIAEEMGLVLCRSAFSPNIKERADCSAALFSREGELLAQAEHIPVHLGAMPASVRAVIDAFGDRLSDGDQVILNDPFCGGTHLNDITLVAPCFSGGQLIGWAANRAHHNDLGGAVAGSMPPKAREIFEEGLRLPPVIYSEAIRDVICTNSRTPRERLGDLNAQVGANIYGLQALAAMEASPFQEVLNYGERRMRAALADMPDGSWSFSDVIDSSGPEEDQRQAGQIQLSLTKSGSEVVFDFTGSSSQMPGSANAVEAVTISCVAFALRLAADPTIPANGGSFRPVKVVAPPKTLVAAELPVAVGAGNVEVSQRISDVCLGALAQVVPERVGAGSQGTMNNILLGGANWVYYETLGGGQGARPTKDGMSGVHTGMTNTKNTPIEALERSYPLRVKKLMLRRASSGEGKFSGGEGIERELEVLEPAQASLICERQISQPWGLAGGLPGANGENWLLPGGEESEARKLLDKVELNLSPGDVIRVLTPGGGGWGEPGKKTSSKTEG